MSRRRSHDAILAYREAFLDGAGSRNVEPGVASAIFDSILAFSGFGFPKSHSVAFALLAYQSAWLKVHYGPEYLCSLLNEQPMGFYPPDSLVQEAVRAGMKVWPPDVNFSSFECTAEWSDDPSGREPVADGPSRPGVRMGLGYIRGLNEEVASLVVRERQADGAFEGVPELASRTGIQRPQMELLAWSGALRSITGSGAREMGALWEAGVATTRSPAGSGQMQIPLPLEPAYDLPQASPWDQLEAEYSSLGISFESHPLELLRGSLDPGVLSTAAAAGCPSGTVVVTAGLVTTRQSPLTARGTVFLLIEDECGVLNLIVPRTLAEKERHLIRTARLVEVEGRIEREGRVANLIVRRIVRLAPPGAEFEETIPNPNSFQSGR